MFFNKRDRLLKKAKKLAGLTTKKAVGDFIVKNKKIFLQIIGLKAFSNDSENVLLQFKDKPHLLALIVLSLPEQNKWEEFSRAITISTSNSHAKMNSSLLHEIAKDHPSHLAAMIQSLQNHQATLDALHHKNAMGESVFLTWCNHDINAAFSFIKHFQSDHIGALIFSDELKTCPFFLFMNNKVLLKALLPLCPETRIINFFKKVEGRNQINLLSSNINDKNVISVLLKKLPENARYDLIRLLMPRLLSDVKSIDSLTCLSNFFTKKQRQALLSEQDTTGRPVFVNCLNYLASIQKTNNLNKLNDAVMLVQYAMSLFETDEEKKDFVRVNSSQEHPFMHQRVILSNQRLLAFTISWLPVELRLESLSKLIMPAPKASIASIGLKDPIFLAFLFKTISTDECYPLMYHLCNGVSGQGIVADTRSMQLLKKQLNDITKESPEHFTKKSLNPFSWFHRQSSSLDENKQLIASADTIEQLQHIFNQTLYQSSSAVF